MRPRVHDGLRPEAAFAKKPRSHQLSITGPQHGLWGHLPTDPASSLVRASPGAKARGPKLGDPLSVRGHQESPPRLRDMLCDQLAAGPLASVWEPPAPAPCPGRPVTAGGASHHPVPSVAWPSWGPRVSRPRIHQDFPFPTETTLPIKWEGQTDDPNTSVPSSLLPGEAPKSFPCCRPESPWGPPLQGAGVWGSRSGTSVPVCGPRDAAGHIACALPLCPPHPVLSPSHCGGTEAEPDGWRLQGSEGD